MWLSPTFYSALDIWKRKKAAHEDRCFKNYLKAKQIDPLARLERFVKPFKYPPFPNAQFGIADRLPDPVKGILSRGYITNPLTPHLYGVTSSPYEWCRETHHLVSGFTKIERYPPEEREKREYSSKVTATLTSRKRNAVERTSDTEGPVAKVARTSQPQKKSKKTGVSGKSSGEQVTDTPKPTAQSNFERARSILSNPATFNRSVSAGLAGVSNSQASTESTQVEYTPLGHETIPVLVSTSCPADTSIMVASSSDLALFKPEMFPIKEGAIDEEGPFVIPTPEASDLDFADDEFNLDSILSEAQENLPEQSTVDRATIIEKVNKVLGCLNNSLEEIVASAEVKSQLLEATTFLSQHASFEASSLESFMEDLYNSNVLLESSSADLRVAKDDLSNHKKNLAKYGATLLKVKPLVDTGSIKEQEARLLEETQRLRVEEIEKELLLAKQNLSSTMVGLVNQS
ncbi:hypothetical protein PIB30_051628 [Stylosanthes scabra]|uniref:Uncharacterized protein n=1 Tax=Stylosanthes scabra TaxID=79078 RepID=A0ABU6THU2_9FABA|nr:hypothetical protein [Stylosanthes scabra]